MLEATGWSPYAEEVIENAGQLAAGVKNLFSKRSKAERAAQKAERENQRAAIESVKLAQSGQVTEKIRAKLSFENIRTMLIRNWIIVLIVAVILFWRPIMRMFNIRRSSSVSRRRRSRPARRRRSRPARRRRSVSVTKTKTKRSRRGTKTKTKRKSTGGSGSFRRKIHGVTYTSKAAWSKKMKSLRKK